MEKIKELMLRAADEVSLAFKKHILDADAGKDVGIGASGSPSEKIDIVCEETALKTLEESGVSVLTEERGFMDKGTKECFVLDPLDGTINAVNGLPFYAFSLAYGSHNLSGMQIGLVRNLVTGDTFWAEKGKGAFLNGKRIFTREFDKSRCMILVYIGKYASEEAWRIARSGNRTRCFGAAALELCLLASGFADIYLMKNTEEKRNLRITDIAAGILILREAGGIALDDKFAELEMPLNLEARRSVVCAGKKEGVEFVKQLLEVRG
ncbi:MAG: inositol monophosphatase family protein [Thermoplasmata archaeon]